MTTATTELCARCGKDLGVPSRVSALDDASPVCVYCGLCEQAWLFTVPHVSLPPFGQEAAFWDPTVIDDQKL